MKHFAFGKNILILTAHPDDETYFAAGTMDQNAKLGGKNMIICATRGEKGGMKKWRKSQFLKAAKLLKVSKLVLLGLPDGRVKDNKEKLYTQCMFVIKKNNPQIILSFGPDGITGHWDHIAVGQVARRIATELSLPFLAFALWPNVTKKQQLLLKSRRIAKTYVRNVIHEQPNIKIRINAKMKRKALQYYFPQNKKPGILENKLSRAEYFRYEHPQYN
ncbi:MAG: PIG-L family deacetylase [bacterium]|nr:PIG-L family deacetylase [bacterium]